MKKSICILFSLTVLVVSTFADKSRFYQNGKVIDRMYVDSEDGLRVRDNPSLKSSRLCALQHRFPVKVVAIGKEETIDGITAPWVEILIPRYEWKDDVAEFGWVFGAYLSKEPSIIFAVPKTKEQLDLFLRSRLISSSKFTFMGENISVMINENVIEFKESANAQWGNYIKILSENKFEYDCSATLINEDPYKENLIFTIISGTENTFRTKVSGKNFETFCTWECKEYSRGICEQLYFTSPSLYFISFFSKMDRIFSGYTRKVDCDFKNSKNIELTKAELIDELIKSGVSAIGTEYEQLYHDYWNPIMAEHQKKADKME